jgi:hypothetical protein
MRKCLNFCRRCTGVTLAPAPQLPLCQGLFNAKCHTRSYIEGYWKTNAHRFDVLADSVCLHTLMRP